MASVITRYDGGVRKHSQTEDVRGQAPGHVTGQPAQVSAGALLYAADGTVGTAEIEMRQDWVEGHAQDAGPCG